MMDRLERDPHVVKWMKRHGITIPWIDGQKHQRRYVPDFLIGYDHSRKVIVEVKDPSRVDSNDVQRKRKAAEVKEQKFNCRICPGTSSESAISLALEKALPSMQWEEGNSSWDKIRVWGEGPDATIRVYRYEEPGPFSLTITLKVPEGTHAEKAYLALRDKVLLALHGRVWKPLEPQPVSLIKLQGRFPAPYQFECDLGIWDVKKILDDAEFWSWEALQEEPLGLYLEGCVPFRPAGRIRWNFTGRIRIVGHKPSYRIEVGNWQDEPDRTPSCDQVHETVQNTILPAIGARNMRGANLID